MRRHAKWMSGGLALWLVVFALVWSAQAAGLEDFKLTRAIPADAAMVVHGRDHAGLAFLHKQFERVWDVFEKQHFEKDLRTLLKAAVEESGGNLEEFDKQWQQFNDLLLGVEWSSLADKELAFTMNFSFPVPEWVFLGQSSPEKAKANFEGLVAVVKTLIGFAPEGELVLSEQGQGDSLVRTVTAPNAPFPLSLMLAREKDVLLLGFGAVMPEQTLALLRGEPGQTLAATERFQAALKRLPPPRDALVFFDAARFVGQLRAYVDKALATADPTGDALDAKMKAVPGKVLDAVDMFEYIASVAATDGMKTASDAVVLLKADAKSKPLYAGLFGNGTLKEPLKFIPQNALDFGAWSGFDFKALYDAVLTFIRTEVPGGEDLVAQWNELKAGLPLDIETDILSWIGGGFSHFSIPGKSAFSRPATVFMLTVRDEAKAREVLGRLLDLLTPALPQQEGIVSDAKIEGAEGFKVISYPALAMFIGQPTVGVKNGLLFIGTSEKAVAAALATGSGANPNFLTNERFIKEGLPLAANVLAVSFTDLTNSFQELGQLLKTAPALTFAPEVAKNPFARTFLMAVGKLGTVVKELDFFQSSCSQTTMDGPMCYTKTITNYREPPKPTTAPSSEPAEPAAEPAAGEKPAGEKK